MNRRPTTSRKLAPQRRRNLHRHQLRRRKFLQHRQREQKLSLLDHLPATDEQDH
jgi:hypothetical protein